jgi:hypothetical protein
LCVPCHGSANAAKQQRPEERSKSAFFQKHTILLVLPVVLGTV